jgi:hypothetical protein
MVDESLIVVVVDGSVAILTICVDRFTIMANNIPCFPHPLRTLAALIVEQVS